MTNSSTGGVLLPAAEPAVPEDADLDAIFQTLVSSITGLPGDRVRPRWQEVPPTEPEVEGDWCAIGVLSQTANDGPQITFSGQDTGPDTYVRHEEIEVLASFYGPHSQANASLLRDGLGIPQNTEQLLPYGMRWAKCGEIHNAAEPINQRWRRRQDLTLIFRRSLTRTYEVLSILSAEVQLIDDTYGVDRTFTVDADTPPRTDP